MDEPDRDAIAAAALQTCEDTNLDPFKGLPVVISLGWLMQFVYNLDEGRRNVGPVQVRVRRGD